MIVKRTLYVVRGLNEGFAESLFMAYKAKALHDDVSEFDIFTISERERLESKGIDASKLKDLEGKAFFDALNDAVSEHEHPEKIPESTFTWLFGDESLLDSKHKRLRVLFFNSARYRRQKLHYYTQKNIITDSNDMDHIRNQLEKFAKTYPGKRHGTISNYELYFGDPSQFSYEQMKRRTEFLTSDEARLTYLKYYNLPTHWSLADIKDYQRKRAIDSDSLNLNQIEKWDNMEFILDF